MDTTRFVAAMRLALHQCGQAALALQGRVTREDKAPDSPHQQSTAVSVVDRICQEVLLLAAHAAAPVLAAASEEWEDCPGWIRDLFPPGGRHVLVVDPLDGTECYLRGGAAWAHMVGLLDREEGRMTASLVYFPRGGALYHAIRGGGAWVARGPCEPTLPLGSRRPPRSFGEVKRLRPEDYRAFQARGWALDATRNRSSAEDLVAVALGEMGASVMRHFHGHDSAIPGLIVEEAGGAVLGEDGGPVLYDASMGRMPLVVASLDPAWARELWETLTPPATGSARGRR